MSQKLAKVVEYAGNSSYSGVLSPGIQVQLGQCSEIPWHFTTKQAGNGSVHL